MIVASLREAKKRPLALIIPWANELHAILLDQYRAHRIMVFTGTTQKT